MERTGVGFTPPIVCWEVNVPLVFCMEDCEANDEIEPFTLLSAGVLAWDADT